MSSRIGFVLMMLVLVSGCERGGNGEDATVPAADAPAERAVLYYRHPHNPRIVSQEPKKDEMGMDYVPVYDDGGGNGVRIAPEVVHNLGVRTAPAERGTLWKRIDTVGYVAYDEGRVWHIHVRAEGWIERLALTSVGQRVKAGEVLFELYAPELATAQREYLQALERGSRALIRASEERLRALGIPGPDIEALRRTREPDARIRFRAAADAVVTRLDVREGMYVTPATVVVSLADLESVWVIAEVFERQADWIAPGRPAEVRLAARPGEVWEGEVQFIYPDLSSDTRTLQVRLRFDNPDETLKPNMLADVILYGGPEHDVVHIPREALIRSGRADRVVLALGEGRFQSREVVAGLESGNRIEIKAGLEPGERVVTSGQFLIDSEASLKQSLERLGGAVEPEPEREP